jgi:hypothetical protein
MISTVLLARRNRMTVGPRFDGVGVSRDQYEQVLNEVTKKGTDRPAGGLTPHAGPFEGVCVVETWESREALQDLHETWPRPALATAGIAVQPRIFEVVNSAS